MLHIEYSYLAYVMFRLRSQSSSQISYNDLLDLFVCVCGFLIFDLVAKQTPKSSLHSLDIGILRSRPLANLLMPVMRLQPESGL